MINSTDDWWWAIDNVQVTVGASTVLSQNFEGLDLGTTVWEPNGNAGNPVVIENVHTATPPPNWSIDNSQVPTLGVPEWRGWNFVDPAFWVAADDQLRSEFLKGQTVIAVADSDEWDDAAHPEGTYNTSMDTPEISLANVTADSVSVTFDSAWRDEGNQYVTLTVSYDGGRADRNSAVGIQSMVGSGKDTGESLLP